MTFGEKLYKLRKEKGFSQEALAEQLNTSRQAISKWENGQGFPETEKLLIIGNIFEVSIDYLLKNTEEQGNNNKDGYYVSREMAEGYILQQRKTAKFTALGTFLMILSTVPYFIFKEEPALYAFLIIMIATPGIVTLVLAHSFEDEHYTVLKQEKLLLDQGYLKELTDRYKELKKRNSSVIVVGICLIAVGGLPILLERKGITMGVFIPYYPISAVLIAAGVYIMIRTTTVQDAYKLLARNDVYINRITFKLRKKARSKVDDL